jgi:hypothetical protein
MTPRNVAVVLVTSLLVVSTADAAFARGGSASKGTTTINVGSKPTPSPVIRDHRGCAPQGGVSVPHQGGCRGGG